MELENRTKLFIGVGAVLIIIALVLIIISARKSKVVVQNTTDEAVQQAPAAEVILPSGEKPINIAQPITKDTKVLSEDTEEAQTKRIAMDFVARFGTYSTDGTSQNLKQLLPTMTAPFKSWAEAQIVQKPNPTAPFESVTSRALSAKTISFSGAQAEFEVSTQRQTKTSSGSKTTYIKASAKLVKIDGAWFIDGVNWQAK